MSHDTYEFLKVTSADGVGWIEYNRPPINTFNHAMLHEMRAALDALIAEHGVPAFVKIDVEGFEADVLAGLTQPVPALSFEFTMPADADLLWDRDAAGRQWAESRLASAGVPRAESSVRAALRTARRPALSGSGENGPLSPMRL